MCPITNKKRQSLINLDNFKEIIELIPKVQNTVQNGIKRLLIDNFDINREFNARKTYFADYLNIFNKKWTGEIVLTINYLKEPYFNDLRNALPLINSRSLTTRLNSLKKIDIIERIVHDTRPVRVSYKMTQFGEGLCSFFTLVLVYLTQHKKEKERIFKR